MKLENEKSVNSFMCAINGIIRALRTEKHLRFDIFVAILMIVLGFALKINYVEWIACVISIGIMIFAELINTAIEYMVDLYTREKNEQAGRTKDISAGAVLILSAAVSVVGLIIFAPKIYSLIVK